LLHGLTLSSLAMSGLAFSVAPTRWQKTIAYRVTAGM